MYAWGLINGLKTVGSEDKDMGVVSGNRCEVAESDELKGTKMLRRFDPMKVEYRSSWVR